MKVLQNSLEPDIDVVVGYRKSQSSKITDTERVCEQNYKFEVSINSLFFAVIKISIHNENFMVEKSDIVFLRQCVCEKGKYRATI